MSLLRYAQILIVFSRGEKEGEHCIDGEVVDLECAPGRRTSDGQAKRCLQGRAKGG